MRCVSVGLSVSFVVVRWVVGVWVIMSRGILVSVWGLRGSVVLCWFVLVRIVVIGICCEVIVGIGGVIGIWFVLLGIVVVGIVWMWVVVIRIVCIIGVVGVGCCGLVSVVSEWWLCVVSGLWGPLDVGVVC